MLTWGHSPKRSMSRGIMLKSGAMLRASGLSKILAQAMARLYVPRASASSRKTSGEHPIKDGDEIALGNARFEFRVG